MKRIAENRYPHSATLFKFCKEALALRFDSNVKVIDQDVGAILSYDPADCSHWKKGKKNIRSLSTLKNLATYLQIDERLLIEIASGKMELEEAVFEYKGYGNFAIQNSVLEGFKKAFFKNPEKWQNESCSKNFEEIFDVNRNAIAQLAGKILREGAFEEAPIYLPEVFRSFKNIELINDPQIPKHIRVDSSGTSDNVRVSVRYRETEMRPYTRFLLAKEIFFFLCKNKDPLTKEFANAPAEISDVQANIFAGMLLIPAKLLRKEVENLDCALDIVSQLTQTFWVSKALMNKRLSDYIEHLN